VFDLGTPLRTPLDLERGPTARPVTGAVQAAAICLRVHIPARFGDDLSTSATVVWSPSKPSSSVLLPVRETLRNRKVINTKAAR
jgi:hypothetical protein